jgi:uncharacterized protein (DUF362 family)/Pyruvate/2-oxoacid:ferredoxin oxidoreductase delta subunit
MLVSLYGDESFNKVFKDKRILVKPNMLSPKPPESGVDTHPVVLEAVIEIIKEAEGIPIVADSPGGFGGFRFPEEVYRECGFKEVVERQRVELIILERQKLKEFKISDGVIYKKFYLPEIVNKVDMILSLAKFKTHTLTKTTGAVKNMLGLIPGMGKMQFHLKAPHADDFGEAIADLYSVVRPRLGIIDGIVSMEGYGPVADTLKNTGMLLAGKDCVAVDTVMGKMIGLTTDKMPVVNAAYRRGLGEGDIEKIKIQKLGGEKFDIHIKDFNVPGKSILDFLPKSLAKFITNYLKIKPKINHKKCKKCQKCLKACPSQAMYINDKDCVRINFKKCIYCLCCRELCEYDAVEIKKNFLAKILLR